MIVFKVIYGLFRTNLERAQWLVDNERYDEAFGKLLELLMIVMATLIPLCAIIFMIWLLITSMG